MTVIVGVLGPGIPLGGFRTGQMDVIATGVPKFRLVADSDFVLWRIGAWGGWVCIYYYQFTWTGGWLVNIWEGFADVCMFSWCWFRFILLD